MGQKFISTRAGGFRITVGGKQQVFPMNEPVEVAKNIVPLLLPFSGFVFPHQEKVAVPYKGPKNKNAKHTESEMEGDQKEGVTDEGTSTGDEEVAGLSSLGLSESITLSLEEAGYMTVDSLVDAIDAGADLTKIYGIGEKTAEEIIAALVS